MSKEYKWWQTGIVYQIYPRSYMDSNNDGIGDLKGIILKLDYIKELGVNTIWLSSFYPSPMYDFGYDVVDYKDIDPIFGNMQDFDELLTEAHKRKLKLIIDLVPNHTSSEHPWFLESRKTKDNPKRDWYIWEDPAPDGGPPTNWLSHFGGSAWEFDGATSQYYLHLFVKQQPDLNYRNPDVRKAMLDVMRFWLDKGVDGFRIDVITHMAKDEKLRNDPMDTEWDGKVPFESLKQTYSTNRPFVHDIIRDMRKVVDEYDNRVMIGETYLPQKELIKYYGKNNDECHQAFNFHLLGAEWKAESIKKIVDEYETLLPEGCWPNYALGNHDRKRLASKVGHNQVKVAAMLLLTLRGTPTVYYGEEIGMHDVKIPLDFIQDPPAVNQPEIADEVGRDPVRTPMQWNDGPNCGFSGEEVKTWLPIADDYRTVNVETHLKVPDSMLNFFKELVEIRQNEDVLNTGDYIPVDSQTENVFTFKRKSKSTGNKAIIILNLDSNDKKFDLESICDNPQLIMSTIPEREDLNHVNNFIVKGNEGVIIKEIK